MSSRILKIIKVPRATPIPDIPINFPKFTNLHLELLEVKDKLKSGLPLIPRSKPVLKAMPKPNETKTNVTTTQTPRDQKVKESVAQKVASMATAVVPDGKTTSKHIKIKKDGEKGRKNGDKSKKKKNESESSELLGELVDSDDSDDDSGSKIVSSSAEETAAGSTGNEDANTQENNAEPEEYDIYAGLSPEERMIKEKEEYLWRFRILKKKYGKNLAVQIPEWTEYSDLAMMKTSYERTIRELYLDDTVETYRTYLVGSWIVMEYVCTELMSIDLGGFAVQQISMMYKYDSLLIELGEKSCERWTTNLPVEVRLIGMILLQAAIFYLGKIITDRMGQGVGELFRGVTGQPPAQQNSNSNNTNNNNNTNASGNTQTSEKPEGKKMRGPKISANEIRERAQK